jgi:DNA-binding transcriptional LysR family regulator|tara:strand:- start:4740 stop:5717 length:978 start_codon:yes stop_codon:yes gene_type:complete
MKKNSNIEISALRVFSAVSDADSLTQAAERLGITQSAVSQTIKQLELQTETQLVLTRSRPIKLTPSGQVLKGYADNLINDTKRMLVDVREASGTGNLPLKVGMIDSFCDVAGLQFMQQVKPFTSKLALRTGLVSPLTQALLSRDLDLLITSDPIDEHPELRRLPLLRDPIVMIVPNHIAKGEDVTPAWLAENVPFVHYNRQSRLGSLTDLIARRLNIELNASYELDSTQTLLRFVQSGQGWALTSGLCLVRYPELLEGTKVISLTKGANARYLSLVYRNNELGDWPAKIADICRSIYTDDIVTQMADISPWLDQQAFSINELPAI